MVNTKDCWIKSNCGKYATNDCDNKEEFCVKLFKLDYLFNESLLTDNQRVRIPLRYDADGTDRENFIRLKEIETNIDTWVKDGNNLLIKSSNCGNGKTAWSIRLIQAYLDKIWHMSDFSCKALFINVPRLMLSLKDNISSTNDYANHIKLNVLDADIVVWDEIGTKSVTSFEHENLLNFINARIEAGKSNVYTSNLDFEQLKASVGDRLYSRIVNYSEVITFNGKDKRGLVNNR